MTKNDFSKGQRVQYIGPVSVYDGEHMVAHTGDYGTVVNVDNHPLIAGPTVRWEKTDRVFDLHPDELALTNA